MALGPVLATLSPTLINVRGRAAESGKETEMTKRKLFEYGGIAAGVILIAFGAASLVMSINGRNTVQDSLKQEAIVGSPDMTPDAIAKAAQGSRSAREHQAADLRASPTSAIDTGAEAKVLRELHAHPRARGHGRPDLRADGSVPVGRCPERPGRDERRSRGRRRTRTDSPFPTAPATFG